MIRMPGDYLALISAGPQYWPHYLDSPAVAPGYLTPDQWWFRERARVRRYGEGDPDRGGYPLAEVIFDKEEGTAMVGQCDVGPSGWYGGMVGP